MFRLPLTYFSFKISTVEEFLVSVGVMLQTFDAKCLNEFEPNFVVLTVFLRKSVFDFKL